MGRRQTARTPVLVARPREVRARSLAPLVKARGLRDDACLDLKTEPR